MKQYLLEITIVFDTYRWFIIPVKRTVAYTLKVNLAENEVKFILEHRDLVVSLICSQHTNKNYKLLTANFQEIKNAN